MFERIVGIVRDRFRERQLEYEIVGGIDSRNTVPDGPGGSNRVAFVPLKDGEFTPPIFIGEGDPDADGNVARQLFTMPIGFDVCCAAFDAETPDDDIANRAACVRLFQAVAQEVHRAYAGQYGWDGFSFDDARKLGRFGQELVARLVMNIPIFDTPWATATPTKARVDQPEEKR